MTGTPGETMEAATNPSGDKAADRRLCDVLVIGGGPAGSTAGALLARDGYDVVVVEKDAHPRFHIGESLLPQNLAVFERLGIQQQVHAMGIYKPGAEFVDEATGRTAAFSFSEAPPPHRHSYQVRRAEFDTLLFETAARLGARTLERTRVTDLAEAGPDGRLTVAAASPDGQTIRFAPRFVLDASGRDSFMASRLRIRKANKVNDTAAVFAHFRGVAPRADGYEGYITIHLSDGGWFWSIPLPDGLTSVGFVGDQAVFRGRGGGTAALFDERVAASDILSKRLTGAERVTGFMTASNYSYRADTNWGDGYMMIGDSFAFVDPVFSSGVLLAMTAAEQGAAVASRWLESPDGARAMARDNLKQLTRQMDELNWLIYRINTPVLRHMFLSPGNRWRMREGLISLLSGNFQRSPRSLPPVLAFKSVYYMLTGMRRLFGWMPPVDTRANA